MKWDGKALGAKVRRVVEEEGLRRLFGKAAWACSRCVVRHIESYIYELDLRKDLPKVKVPVRLSYRMAHEADILNFDGEKYDFDEGAKKYLLERMKHGDRCILASLNNRIVGYMWIMNGAMELSQGSLVTVSKENAYIYKGFVISEARGQRVLAGLDRFAINLLRREGARCMITTVDAGNLPALTARKRIGFEKIGVINHYWLLGSLVNRVHWDTLKYLQSPIIS